MVNAYDTLSDGQKWNATLQNEVGTALGAINNVAFRPAVTANYIIFTTGGVFYRKNGNTGEIDDNDADYTNVITQAITDLSSIGGRIHHGTGEFLLKDTVTASLGANISINISADSMMNSVIKLDASINKDMFDITADKFSFSNIKLDGNKANQTSSGLRAIYAHRSGSIGTDLHLHGVYIFNVKGIGVQSSNYYDYFSDSVVEYSDDWGWYLTGEAPGLTNCWAYDGGNGIKLETGIGAKVVGGGIYKGEVGLNILSSGVNVTSLNISQTEKEAVKLAGARNKLVGCEIRDICTDTDNTYDAVDVGGTGYHTLLGNIISASLANKPRYCINETAGNYNIIALNTVADGQTGQINRTGANTLIQDNPGNVGAYQTQTGGWANPSGTPGHGTRVTVYNSTAGEYRLYTYANSGWRYVALT